MIVDIDRKKLAETFKNTNGPNLPWGDDEDDSFNDSNNETHTGDPTSTVPLNPSNPKPPRQS